MQEKLNKIKELAHSSKIKRLLESPVKYISGTFFSHFIYPQTKKGKLVRTSTFFGREMQLLLPAGMDIYLLGGKGHDSEIRLSYFLYKNLSPGDTFIDVGAHFGYFSLMGAQIVGDAGRVFSIEASPAVFEILQKNTAAQKNITINHLACTSDNSSISFFEFPIFYSEYNTVNPAQFDQEQWIKDNPPQQHVVEGRNLDSLIAENNLAPRLVKIDVEGAESDVINGMVATLAQYPALKIAMEFLGDSNKNQAHKAASLTLDNAGFKSHLIEADGSLTPIPFKDIPQYLQDNHIDSDNIVFAKY